MPVSGVASGPDPTHVSVPRAAASAHAVRGIDAPPLVPDGFWEAAVMAQALRSRHMGRVIRAYRTHDGHGRPIAQERMAQWLGMTQSKLSRLETGPRPDRLDLLVHWARVLRIPGQHLWFALPDEPTDEEASASFARVPAGSEPEGLGPPSARRTDLLLETVDVGDDPLPYMAPTEALENARGFVGSSSRVLIVDGHAGVGKTSLTYFLAHRLADDADVQLHSVDSWTPGTEVASEILRYASLDAGQDSLLLLERLGRALLRPCVVVVDGIKTQDQVDEVGRQIDRVLRQVTTPRLKFVLTVRTPPRVDVSAFPILAASVHGVRSGEAGVFRLGPWADRAARDAWNSSRRATDPPFAELPAQVQQLVRTPLYMRLVRLAGPTASSGEATAYRLVDYCVRSLLATSGMDGADVMGRLGDLAAVGAPDVLAPLPTPADTAFEVQARLAEAAFPLVRTNAEGGLRFDHDVIREYFLAACVVDRWIAAGPSVSTIRSVNELASRALASATARGVFIFAVSRMDELSPELAAYILTSPAASLQTTLPLVLTASAEGSRFVTATVVRTCAERCDDDASNELTQALLGLPNLARDMGAGFADWLRAALRRFGPMVWDDAANCVERELTASAAARLIAAADLDTSAEATFFARHFFLFCPDDQALNPRLRALISHSDWRVRAAVAEGLSDRRAPRGSLAAELLDWLVSDGDYKVRATVARAVATATRPTGNATSVRRMLRDSNWHVREAMLRAVIDASSIPVTQAAVATVRTDPSWQSCPAHIGVLMHRLLLLSRDAGGDDGPARRRALFLLLRESRTNSLQLPDEVRSAALAEGAASSEWLVQREARALTDGASGAEDARSAHETFRRLRGGRAVQVALDVHDLSDARRVADAAATAGADLIEVGDPLIKHVGLAAIEQVKRAVPTTQVIAEMMSSDWGRDQVVLAAGAGADVVLLIGPASRASVSAAVVAGKRLGVPILLDIPVGHATRQWVREMERAGVDGFSITTNIDLGVEGDHPLAKARRVRSWTRLPVAVSGGFSSTDQSVFSSPDWDILIFGRSITEALDPHAAARHIVDLAHPAPSGRTT